jgi:hypothetical protein
VSRHRKTAELIETAAEILRQHHPMTIRQLYYQLVSRQVIENSRSAYQSVSKALVAAQREGLIPWAHIEDRLRRPRCAPMWSGLPDFAVTAAGWYRRGVWESLPVRIEVWLEMDALSGIFEDLLDGYGVTLNVSRGFDGWGSIHNAARRLEDGDVILYFGDFDPSGEDMVRSLRDRLADQGSRPEIKKCALVFQDIERYQLPPDFTKASDTRSAAFVAKWGDVSVELDALPIDVLRERIVDEVERRIDLTALETVRAAEEEERRRLVQALGGGGRESCRPSAAGRGRAGLRSAHSDVLNCRA